MFGPQGQKALGFISGETDPGNSWKESRNENQDPAAGHGTATENQDTYGKYSHIPPLNYFLHWKIVRGENKTLYVISQKWVLEKRKNLVTQKVYINKRTNIIVLHCPLAIYMD